MAVRGLAVVALICRAVAASARILAFSSAVRQISPSGSGGRSRIATSRISSRRKCGAAGAAVSAAGGTAGAPVEQEQLAGIRAQCPHLDALARHVIAFAEMMAGRTGTRDLDDWLAAAGADDQPELHSFATGIRQDKEAVVNGLTLPHSSAKVECTVNKIKTVKRQMYGRAGFPLLRQRVMMHPA